MRVYPEIHRENINWQDLLLDVFIVIELVGCVSVQENNCES